MVTRVADVAVIGAGPAGAAAAFALARAGARVTVFDGSHPREKPCGGGVTERALDLVADAIDVSRLPATTIDRVRFTSARTSVGALVPLPAPALVVASRATFDRALLDAARGAGAALVESRVTDIAREAGRLRLETSRGSHHTSFVVGADGANSLVRRRFARPFSRHELSVATGYFAHGSTSTEIVIELGDNPPGYLWSFPRPDHLAVGICAQADAGYTSTALRARTATWMRTIELGAGARLEPYSWPIPSLDRASFDRLDLGGSDWCVVGDAAGLVDPITREGIYFALLSGQLAAGALIKEAPTEYAPRVRDVIVPELVSAAQLKAAFFRPVFTSLLVGALAESAAIRAVMADLVAGRQTYAGLKWRLLKTFEIRLAWRTCIGSRRSK